jgi:hypothetical protein
MPATAVSAALGLDPRACGLFGASGFVGGGEADGGAPAATAPCSVPHPNHASNAAAAVPASPRSPHSSSLSAPSPLRALLAFATSPPRSLTLRAFSGLANNKQQPQQQQQQQQPPAPPLPSPPAAAPPAPAAPAPAPLPARRRSLRSAVREVESRWYREALVEAKSGDAEAMLRVAEMCEVGYGTPVDYDLADDWRELAEIATEKQRRRQEQEEEQQRQQQHEASASASPFSASERPSSELPRAPSVVNGAARSFGRMSLVDSGPVAPAAFSSGSMLSAQISLSSGIGGA